MNRLLKLVAMEVHRLRLIFAGMIGMTALVQIVALVWAIYDEMRMWETYKSTHPELALQPLSMQEMIHHISSVVTFTIWLSAFVMGACVFAIWYRDWMGRSSFMHRLLMLPTNRRHLYVAKVVAIMLLTLAYASFQFMLLYVHEGIARLIVPSDRWELSLVMDAARTVEELSIMLPPNGWQWAIHYALALIAVCVVFTGILLERCFGRLGIVYGLLYVASCAALVALPVAFQYEITFLYPGEIQLLTAALCLAVLGVSLWLGLRLVAKKITV